MLNENIIKWFSILIKQLEFQIDIKKGNDKIVYSFKLKAIKNALKIIKSVKFKITDKNVSLLKEYRGIGDRIIGRVDEILKTGKLSEINEEIISEKHLDYINELMKIYGIGRIKAYELYNKYGIKSISELKIAIEKKTIDLPDNIIKGLKYVDKIKGDIPRSEMSEIYLYLIKVGIELDNNMDVRMCGSFRREQPISGDIDIIISHPDIITKTDSKKSDLLEKFVKLLKDKKFIIESLTTENTLSKYMGICQLSKKHLIRRIDIMFIPNESYYTAILYFTGSAEFNRQMRNVAISMGYTLNEYCLKDDKQKSFKINSEKDIFDYLLMEYVLPKYRN